MHVTNSKGSTLSAMNADSYANLLEHAPVLLGPKGTWVAAGPDSARFLAEAVEPFMLEPVLDRPAIVERLTRGNPPALGDGGRSLTPEEAQRVLDVCDLMRVGTPGLNVDVQPRTRREPDPREWNVETEGLFRGPDSKEVSVTVTEFLNLTENLLGFATQMGITVRVVDGDDRKIVASLVPGEPE